MELEAISIREAGALTKISQAGTLTFLVFTGIGHSAIYWELFASSLGTGCVWVWNRPGYAGSKSAKASPEHLLAALAASLQSRRIRPDVLIGHSLGAAYAAALPAWSPLIPRTVLIDPPDTSLLGADG